MKLVLLRNCSNLVYLSEHLEASESIQCIRSISLAFGLSSLLPSVQLCHSISLSSSISSFISRLSINYLSGNFPTPLQYPLSIPAAGPYTCFLPSHVMGGQRPSIKYVTLEGGRESKKV